MMYPEVRAAVAADAERRARRARVRPRRAPRGGPARQPPPAARGRRLGARTSTPTGSGAGSTCPPTRCPASSCTRTAAASCSTTSTSTTRVSPAHGQPRPPRRCSSVDYRRPPEHPFPAAPDDLDTVVGWLRPRGPARAVRRPRRLAPAPTSPSSPRCATPASSRAVALVYPFLDPRTGFPSWPSGAASGFDPRRGRPGTGSSTPAPRPTYDDPDLAPLLSDRLHTLPPTFVATAEHDPLRDEGEELARRIAEAGVEVVGIRCLGQTHGFWRARPVHRVRAARCARWPAGSTSTSSASGPTPT